MANLIKTDHAIITKLIKSDPNKEKCIKTDHASTKKNHSERPHEVANLIQTDHAIIQIKKDTDKENIKKI